MCGPAAGPIIMAVSAAVSAYGMQQQGQYQKAIAKQNADTMEAKASEARSIGAIQADEHRAKVRQMLGAQIARQGASGAEVGVGSFGKILDQTAMYGEMDAKTIQRNALAQAWGYDQQATSDKLSGDMYGRAGTWNAAGTILGAAGGFAKAGQAANWWRKS